MTQDAPETPTRLALLRALSKKTEPVWVQDLAGEVGMTTKVVASSIMRSAVAGLVTYETYCPVGTGWRKRTYCIITDKGRAHLAAIDEPAPLDEIPLVRMTGTTLRVVLPDSIGYVEIRTSDADQLTDAPMVEVEVVSYSVDTPARDGRMYEPQVRAGRNTIYMIGRVI